tara:strand:+ start:2828 stop:3286 length:459 start_codon:yes stop_codon:yes gene_type:complete
MSVSAIQRNATNNQSTVDYTRKQIFIYGNEFQSAILANTTIVEQIAVTGQLVTRDTATAGQVNLATASNLADVIGITFIDSTTLAVASSGGGTDGGTTSLDYAVNGTIDNGLLELPATVTLDTVVGNKALRDILNDLGFILRDVTENSKIDN